MCKHTNTREIQVNVALIVPSSYLATLARHYIAPFDSITTVCMLPTNNGNKWEGAVKCLSVEHYIWHVHTCVYNGMLADLVL